jgi:hypothetical protein
MRTDERCGGRGLGARERKECTLECSLMTGPLLLTLVDHAKPFKGTWQIHRISEERYAACHSPSPEGAKRPQPPSCQVFIGHQQICRFTALLQFHGWSMEGHSAESLRFRQACAL